jgi:hypothetical protein
MRSIAVVLAVHYVVSAVHYVVSAVHYVIPAKAGTQVPRALMKRQQTWVPAFAGTTI